MKFKTALFVIAGILVLHLLFIASGAYFVWSWLDVPMHFFGGFAMGMLGLAIHHSMASRGHTSRTPWWYHSLFVVGFAMLIGVAWEFHEYLWDNTVHLWYGWPKSQLSLADTMGDFLMDFLGAAAALACFRKSL